MVLGISARLLPGQRFTSVPFLMISGVVLAYIFLFASQRYFSVDEVRALGISNRDLNRVFWIGMALVGSMALYQREIWLGISLMGMSVSYFVMSVFGYGLAMGGPFFVAVIVGFIYIGIWLRKTKTAPVKGNYSLSWWAVGLMGIIMVSGVTAALATMKSPVRDTESFKAAAGFYPDEPLMAYEEEAREPIESYIGKSLPPGAHDMRFEFTERERGEHGVLIYFKAEPEDVKSLIESGLLCFKVDIDDIPITEVDLDIDDIARLKSFTQFENPWHASMPWWWTRNKWHIKGYCPYPNPYSIKVYFATSDYWWVSIGGYVYRGMKY